MTMIIAYLCGFRGMYALSDSMAPQVNRGDFLLVYNGKEALEKGDIIVFGDKKICHRIIDIDSKEIITKGDANLHKDKAITIDEVHGKVILTLPYLGYLPLSINDIILK